MLRSSAPPYSAPKLIKKPRNLDCLPVDDSATSPGYSVDSISDLDLDYSSCPSCKIDLSSRVLTQRKQHVRRCKQPPPNEEGTYKCDSCSSTFPKYASLRLHMKHTHPVEYNTQDEHTIAAKASSTRSKWTTAEEKQLARLEACLPTGLTQKEINSRLSNIHTGRSLEGIKKQRLKPSYKSILSEILANSNFTNKQSLGSAINTYRDVCPRTPRLRLERIDSISPWSTILQPSTSTDHSTSNEVADDSCYLITHRDICSFIKELAPSCTTDTQNLIQKLFDNYSFEQLDPVISAVIRNFAKTSLSSDSDPPNKNKPKSQTQKKQRRKPIQNRAAARASMFGKFQRLFASNPTQLAHVILDNKEISTSIFPKMEDIEAEFRPLFEKCPRYTAATPQHPPETVHLDHPITFRETELALRRLKQSASGPDGITREDLRAIDMADLVALLNIVFGLCHTPSILRHNRTVLIPKKGDLSKVSNWRPITVSSLFTRLLHKILASRLSENIKLHHAQRGFTRGDGVMSSSTILDTIVREHRINSKPLFVLSIDLTKAFDKIHPKAIENSLISKGVDLHTIRYIMSTYSDADTIIECHGQRSSPIRICRGVRQGDTDSPILFNIALDDFVSSIDSSDGVRIGETKIGCLLFADDIVLVSNTEHGLREHLHKLNSFLQRTHMELNPSKCRALQLARVPGTKRIAVDTKPRFEINGKSIPTLKVLEQLKYLGHSYNQRGMIVPSAANLESMLDRLRRAALRPWQKLFLLNRYLIPRLLHCNQSSDITIGKLEHIDRLIRRFIKATLHLPVTTPTAFLYAKIRDGGLSIPCIRHQVGVIYRRRLQRISLQCDPDFLAVFQTPSVNRLMRKLDLVCQGIPSSRSAIARFWASNLHRSALGSGLEYSTRATSSWIMNPPPFWSGRDYIRAIQLRIGLLPTAGAPYVKAEAARCRHPTCEGRRETLSHVLQWCPVTHYQRIQRHDRITQDLANHLKSTGFQIQHAPRVHTRDNRYIPDLLVVDTHSHTASIIESTVVWERGSSLLEAAKIKKDKYNIPELLDQIKSKYNLQDRPQVLPFVVGARGSWAPSNHLIWKHYKLTDFLQRIIICNVLRYGSSIHRYFMSHTWRSRKKKKKK